MRAGRLRHQVTIQQLTRTTDGAGGYTQSWSTFATVWAQVTPVRGLEQPLGDGTAAPITHEVRLRWVDGVRPDMRISHDGRTLTISGPPLNIDERDREMVLTCSEATP